jgi:hypothetical protein
MRKVKQDKYTPLNGHRHEEARLVRMINVSIRYGRANWQIQVGPDADPV